MVCELYPPRLEAPGQAFEVKADMLVNGVYVDPSVVQGQMDFKERLIMLYAPDDEEYSTPIPYDIKLMDFRGETITCALRTTRNNSGWQLTRSADSLVVKRGSEMYEVRAIPRPRYYDLTTQEGLPLSTQVSQLGTDGLGVIMSNYCSYFRDGLECKFCEIEPTYRDLGGGSPVKRVKTVVDAVSKAIESAGYLKYVLLNGGNTPSYDGTVRMYLSVLKELRDRGILDRVRSYGVMMPPKDLNLMDQLYENGLDHIAFNLEIWDKNIFRAIVPGKATYGYDNMRDALRRAVRTYGESMVYTVLIYGLQSFGNARIGGLDYGLENEMACKSFELVDEGVVPLYSVYHTSLRNKTGRIRLSLQHTLEFHRAYAQKLVESNLIKNRENVVLGLGTVPNHLYNDAYAVARYSGSN